MSLTIVESFPEQVNGQLRTFCVQIIHKLMIRLTDHDNTVSVLANQTTDLSVHALLISLKEFRFIASLRSVRIYFRVVLNDPISYSCSHGKHN